MWCVTNVMSGLWGKKTGDGERSGKKRLKYKFAAASGTLPDRKPSSLLSSFILL